MSSLSGYHIISRRPVILTMFTTPRSVGHMRIHLRGLCLLFGEVTYPPRPIANVEPKP